MDYGLAARTALQVVQQELATKEVEQWVRSELEITELREKLDILGRTTKEEDNQETKKQDLKLNVISGKTFGMTREGTKTMLIISVAGHQVAKNLCEPSEITLVLLDIYAEYLREKDPKLDYRVVRALLTTGWTRLMEVDAHYIEVFGPYPILMNVGGIDIYTKAHVTAASDQVGRIYIGCFSLTQSGLCVSVLLNTEATTVTIQRGKKLGYALPLHTDYQSVENFKRYDVTVCLLHAKQECILKRISDLKSSKKLFSMKSN